MPGSRATSQVFRKSIRRSIGMRASLRGAKGRISWWYQTQTHRQDDSGNLGKLGLSSTLLHNTHFGCLECTLVNPHPSTKHNALQSCAPTRCDYNPCSQWMSVRRWPNGGWRSATGATWYPAAASRGPVIVWLHSTLQAGHIRDTGHLLCHTRIVQGNPWL